MRIKPFFNVSKIKIIFLISVGIFLISNFVLASPWPLFGQNLQHTGQSEYSGPETNEIQWTYENVVSRSHTIDSNGTVYLESNQASRNHEFQAINPDSTLKWSIQLGSSMNPLLTPIIDSNGMIYLVDTYGNLYAIDSNDGDIEWNISLSEKATEPVLSENGIIYIATQFVNGGNLYAIDSSDGDISWIFTQDKGGFRKSPVIGHNGIIYLPSSRTYGKSYLFAINPLNDPINWEKQISNFDYTTSPVIDKNGTIYIADKTTFYFLDSDGEINWSKSIGPNGSSAYLFMPSIDNDREMVYLPTSCCGLQAYDFGGNLKWIFQGEDNDCFRSQPTIDSNGTIYLVGQHLYAINPDGSLKWSDQENLYLNFTNYISTPTIGIDGSLYVNPFEKLVKFGFNSPYPPPEKYAPNLWFDSDESYYPIDPFFYADDIDGISGEASKTKYLNDLSDEEKKKDKFTVFYHVAETEDKTQWVYEYFFYYAYNNFWNEHYHDWEGVFVFVDKETEEVERVVASAHGNWANNNEYFNPNFDLGKHPGIMIERGSHANCIDRNNDGLFQGSDITNGPFPFAWEIRERTVKDKNDGYQIQSEIYLPNLIKITDGFIDKFKNHRSFPILNSPTLGIGCITIPIFGGRKCALGVGGDPPEHPWVNEAYNEPEKIIPKYYNYIHGTINPLFIPGLTQPTMGIILIMSEEPYPFTFTNENGEFLINNIESGEHNIIVNLENYAPYKQRFIIEENGNEENEIIAGVNGILNLIPESESFRFEGIAKDGKGDLIINAIVDVYDKNNQKLFTTLTDEDGQYLFNLSSENNHTIEIIQKDKIGEIENISANPGETVIEETIVSNPMLLKEDTLSKLKEIKTNNQKVKNQIDKMIKLIEESLNDSFWIDSWHLEEKKNLGLKVFQKEYKAAKRIEKVLKYSESKYKKNNYFDFEIILPILNKVANDLSQADYLLSETILNETKKEIKSLDEDKLNKKQKKLLKIINKKIKVAESYLEKAEKQRLKKNYSKSIHYSLRSWIFSKQTKSFLNLIKKKGE